MHYKQIFNIAGVAAVSAFFCVGCSEKPDEEGGGGGNVVYDTPVTIGGETYQTVVIGTQTWFARNLNYAANGSVCYENSADSCAKYGRLYDWETAKTACPTGWHLPSDKEWTELTDFLGGTDIAGKKLKSKTGWNDHDGNQANTGTDNYGFSALPAGVGDGSDDFFSVGSYGYWWSSTEAEETHAAWNRSVVYELDIVYPNYRYAKTHLLSVRCVKD